MRATIPVLPFLLAGAASAAAPQREPRPAVRAGEHFQVVFQSGDERTAGLALATAEAAWPLAAALFGVEGPPATPHALHLFRRTEDFRAVERVVTGGRFRDNLAFTSWETRKTYIALQPECSDAVLERIGLPALTRRLILHEATHLVSYHALANYREHPDWLAEGLANWVADEVMRREGWSLARESEPISATDIRIVQQMLATGVLPGVERILADDLGAMFEGQRYALAWSFVDFLMQHRREPFLAALRELRTLPAGELGVRLPPILTARLAPEGAARLEAEYHAYLRAFAPAWRVTARSLASFEGEWVQLGFPRVDAVAWRSGSVGAGGFVIEGEVELLGGPVGRRSARVLLEQRPSEGGLQENWVYVEFAAGHGVGLRQHQDARRFRLGPEGSVELAEAEVEGLGVGVRVPFRIAVEGGRIAVRVMGGVVLDEPLDVSTLTGALGLGASAGTGVLWRGVRVERMGGGERK